MSSCHLKEQDCLSLLPNFSKLTALNLSINSALEDLSYLSGFANLRILGLTKISPNTNFLPIRTLTNLRDLTVDEISAEFLPQGLLELYGSVTNMHGHINRVPQSLTSLEIFDSQLDDPDMEELAKYTRLRSLSIESANGLTNNGLLHLSKLTNLKDLCLPTNASEDVMSRLKNFLNLTHLDRF